jgi:transposase
MKNKSYTTEFKVKAVEMLKDSQKTQEQVSKELGIGDSTLSKWRRQYEAGAFQRDPATTKVPSSSDKEIARLTAELRRKTMEVEILKKATAFFAKESL